MSCQAESPVSLSSSQGIPGLPPACLMSRPCIYKVGLTLGHVSLLHSLRGHRQPRAGVHLPLAGTLVPQC